MAVLETLSAWAVPALITIVLVAGLIKKVPLYETFVDGAKDGLKTGVRIIPFLIAMFVAIGLFRESGALNLLLRPLAPLARLFAIPSEVLPLALLRPLSGSGSLGYLADLLKQFGPDSPQGFVGSAMQGSTETTFYVLTVYFGAVGIRRVRHAAVVGVLADLAGFVAACLAATWFYRSFF